MNGTHQPRPEFVSYLEWQVRTAHQRRDRFTSPARRSPVKIMRVAALIIVSIFCGAAGVMAKDQIQESKNKAILLAQIETRMEVARLRLEVVRAHLEEVREQQEAQLISGEEATAATIALREAEVEVARLRLDFEEVMITGEEPQNELTAPLVGERDFVTERLRLQLLVAQAHLETSRQHMARIRQLEEAGAISTAEVLAARTGIVEAENGVRIIENNIRLRRQFLGGSLTAEQTELEKEIGSLRRRLEIREQNLGVVRRVFEIDNERYKRGEVSEQELLRSRVQVVEAEAELEILRLQLERLTASIQRIPPDLQ